MIPEPQTDIDQPAVIDDVTFRRVLGHFATGLTIVTGAPGGTPLGFTCQSFTSVSMRPPLVGIFVRREASSWPGIESTGVFCVNVLAERQEPLARIFALKGADKYKDVTWEPAPSGSPVLAGSIAWIDCAIESVSVAGDHLAVLGRITTLMHVDNARPLVYFRGGYGHFAS